MARATRCTVLTLLTALLLAPLAALHAADDAPLADGKPKPAVSVASAGTAGATVRAVPPLEECLRRINIITAENDEGHRSVFESLKNDGIIDCDCDYWVFVAQVHGYTTFDSAVGRQFPGIKASTPLADTVRLVRGRHPGARMVAYLHPRATFVFRDHPEWQAKLLNGTDLTHANVPLGCLNTSYTDAWLKPFLKELIDRFDFDGFWFDGGTLLNDECACDTCRRLFEAQTRFPFPTPADVNGQKNNYQHWLRWRVEMLERRYAELTAYVRSLKAMATLQVNSYPGRSWQSGESRPGHSAGLSRAVSDASLELFWHVDDPANPLHSGLVSGLGRALAGGRMSEIWFPPTCHGVDSVAVPTAELRARVWTAFAHGVVPQIPIGGWKNVQDLQQVFRDIKLRQPYLTRLNSLKYAALVVHPNNGANPLDPLAREDLKAEVMGVYRMLVEEHVLFDVLTEINLEQDDLTAYKVVILPEYFHLSVDAEKNLRQFVRNGGGLVATGRTSLFQPDGKPGGKFQLRDLLGARFVSSTDLRPLGITESADNWLTLPKEYFPEDRKLHDSVSRCRHGMGTTNRDVVDYWGNLAEVEADGATCVLEILGLRNASVPKRPFLLRNRSGKGNVSYLAGRVGQSYEKYSYPHLRRIVVNEISRTAGSQPPVQIDAPLCVEASCWTQTNETGGNRVVIQLLNDLAGRGRPAVVRGCLPLREEVVRVAGIRIRLSKPFGGLMLRTEPEGVGLDLDAEGWFHLPSLGDYQLLVGEKHGGRAAQGSIEGTRTQAVGKIRKTSISIPANRISETFP